jgi:hypothetical protein
MVAEPKPQSLTIDEAQEALAKLAAEEDALPHRVETLTAEQFQARKNGDFRLAAERAEEIAYLSGARREGIKQERQLLKRSLWDAMASELERQAAEFNGRIPAQKEQEDAAHAVLVEVSGCWWQPKIDLVENLGRQVHTPQRPLSEQWGRQANYRKQLSRLLRGSDPEMFGNTVAEAWALIKSEK